MSGPNLDTLYYGDCIDWMSRWDDSSVDLIYLDPPFNSNANYNLLYSSEGGGDAQFRAFSDTWSWDAAAGERLAMFENASARPAHHAVMGLSRILGECGMLAYVTYMAERLEHMHRLLKPTGSIYIHCDPTASHYIKVIMDMIFGAKFFRNEIVWGYKKLPNKIKAFQRNHDIILFYSKTKDLVFNVQRTEPDEGSRKTYESAKRIGYNTNLSKNMVTVFNWEKYNEAVATGRLPSTLNPIEFRGGNPPMRSWWTDIKILGGPKNRERIGYPTQKPLELLKRIILASSNEGDVVLDPFCGCGTTIEAANRLNRRFVGIDISAFAIDLIRQKRLKDHTIRAEGIPADFASARKLAAEQPFSFEAWAVTRLPGFAPNARQRGDRGIDGRATLAVQPDDHQSKLALAQVKGGKFNLSQFRDFRHVLNRESAALGCYVTLEPVPAATRADAKSEGCIHVEGRAYDRLSPWSISHYFEQRLPNLPVMTDPYSGKSLAQGSLF